MVTKYGALENDLRGLLARHLMEKDVSRDVTAQKLRALADEVEAEDGFENENGIPIERLHKDDVHGSFGGSEHYRLIQAAIHRLVNRYYEKNSKLTVENEELSFQADLGSGFGSRASRGVRAEKVLNPDIVMRNQPGERGMKSKKTIIVECETSKHNLLTNTKRMAAYQILREDNKDRNKLMMYIAFPEELRGKVSKPEWANDTWHFSV